MKLFFFFTYKFWQQLSQVAHEWSSIIYKTREIASRKSSVEKLMFHLPSCYLCNFAPLNYILQVFETSWGMFCDFFCLHFVWWRTSFCAFSTYTNYITNIYKCIFLTFACFYSSSSRALKKKKRNMFNAIELCFRFSKLIGSSSITFFGLLKRSSKC